MDEARQTNRRREFIDTRVRSDPRQAHAPPAPRITAADCARWVGREPPEIPFTIADLVPKGMTTLMVAHGGAGKTMLSLQAMAAIPTGIPFLGKATVGGNTAGLFAEDPEGVLHARMARITESMGVDMEALAGRCFPQSFAGVDAALWRGGKVTPLFNHIEEDLRQIRDLELLCIDNVALVFADNENDRIAVTGFVNAMNGLADRIGCGIILSTHTSKSTDDSGNRLASGSTAWVNACRSVIVLKTDDADPDRVTLKLAKANHGRRGSEIPLTWSDGVLVPEDAPGGTVAMLERRSVEIVFLETLAAVLNDGIRPSYKAAARDQYAPKVLIHRREARGFKLPDLERAMRALIADGRVQIRVEKDAYRRVREFIAPVNWKAEA
ncbi:AAA family ATPase [Azospirillum sp. sgz301742]